MDDAELYLYAEPNPMAAKLREQLVAMGLMPQDQLAHNVADDEPIPGCDDLEGE